METDVTNQENLLLTTGKTVYYCRISYHNIETG